MRILSALAFLVLLATFAPPSLHHPDPPPARTLLWLAPIPLEKGAPLTKTAGRLAFLGGWEVTSNDPRFGGISAMHVGTSEVMAVSDAGSLIRFPLPGAGRTYAARIEALPAGPGSAEVKSDRDAESMAVHGSRLWVGFERSNAVWRYRLDRWQSEASAAPRGMRRWRGNRGAEAMLRLPRGRFLIFSEGGAAESEVLLCDGDPALPGTRTTSLRYRPPAGYRITDAALLPGGQMLLLNRRFAFSEGLSAKLVLAPAYRGGAGVLAGEEIADLRWPLAIDNMEALSVTREGGRNIVWIASDDNFNPLQRTLLLKFALLE